MPIGNTTKFRPMTMADLKAANTVIEAAIMTWSVSDRVKRLSLPSHRYQPHDLDHLTIRVAEDAAGEVIGVAAWEPAKAADAPQGARALLLHGIYVEPELQGKDIGSRLLDASIQTARHGGFDDLRVLCRTDNYGFSAPLVFRSKAQRAGNGHSLFKRCNAAAGHQGSARRVSLSAPMDGVAPLEKGAAIPCEARLAMGADKLTELAIISWTEH